MNIRKKNTNSINSDVSYSIGFAQISLRHSLLIITKLGAPMNASDPNENWNETQTTSRQSLGQNVEIGRCLRFLMLIFVVIKSIIQNFRFQSCKLISKIFRAAITVDFPINSAAAACAFFCSFAGDVAGSRQTGYECHLQKTFVGHITEDCPSN